MAADLSQPHIVDYELIIIGAGPAGLAVGIGLSRLRPEIKSRILILEREQFPRRKLCGGGLTQDAERLLLELGLDINEIPSIASPTIQLRYQNIDFEYQSPPSALRVVDRMIFDAWMANKALSAGVNIHFGEKVINVQNCQDHALVRTEKVVYRAKIAFVGNGSRSTFLPSNTARNKAKLVEVVLQNTDHEFTHPLFDLSAKSDGFDGYYWAFPSITDGVESLNIGLYDANLFRHDRKTGAIHALRTWASKYGLAFADSQVLGAPINLLLGNPIAQDGPIFFIGDAIGTEALLGEGISFALGSGILAANLITATDLKIQNPNFQRAFSKSPLNRALRHRAWFAQIFYFFHWDWTTATLWRVFNPWINFIMRHYLLGWSAKIKLGK